jgi:hypothetical protein
LPCDDTRYDISGIVSSADIVERILGTNRGTNRTGTKRSRVRFTSGAEAVSGVDLFSSEWRRLPLHKSHAQCVETTSSFLDMRPL